ncbi:MAG: NUDIX hydrolase [Clostridia bacterium]|nr:NUDIX hydrolase [Clostridia bacterium]
MDLIEKTLSSTTIYDGKVIKVIRDQVSLPNGESAYREIVHHNGGATVLAVKDDMVYFVRQYRYAYHDELLELPAGKLNEGEDPKSCAIRELEEETGLKATDVDLITKLYPSPGYTDEVIYVYLARDFVQGTQHLDEDEFLGVITLPLSTVKDMLDSGEIRDAKTIVALRYYLSNTK